MVNFTTKSPSQWINPSGEGYVSNIGNLDILENISSLPIIINGFLLPLLTTPIQSTSKHASLWVGTGV